MQQFYKYQSLGNDFVLFDWLEEDYADVEARTRTAKWPDYVRSICDRHYGVGADGLLVVARNAAQQIRVMIFNADGSNGGRCLNGIRCAAHYLVVERKLAAQLQLLMGRGAIECFVDLTNSVPTVRIEIGDVKYIKQHVVALDENKIVGHIVDAGNPHYVVFAQADLNWLETNGRLISEHVDFPNRTNVEYVVYNPINSDELECKCYDVLVYERGVGITLACGTGAAAVMCGLRQLHYLANDEEIALSMLGGNLKTSITTNGKIFQLAAAHICFSGKLPVT